MAAPAGTALYTTTQYDRATFGSPWAQLIEVGTKRTMATREFDEVETAPSDDPYGGVIEENRARERLLGQLADFCAEQPVNR